MPTILTILLLQIASHSPMMTPTFWEKYLSVLKWQLNMSKNMGAIFEDELTLYVVHGFLHLLGLDDQTDQDRKKMRAEEKKWMRTLAKNKLRITLHRK